MEKLKIIIATESYVVNQGLHLIFNKLRYGYIVDKVDSMSNLYQVIEKEKVDIIMISTSFLEGFSLNELLKKLGDNRPRFIAYCAHKSSKIENKNIFINSINYDDSKEIVLEKLSGVLDDMRGNCSENESSDLSEREKDILKQVALGLTNNEIADRLFISAHTVITHRKKITKKLGIKSVSGLTVYAIINGLIEMEEVGKSA